MSRLKSSGQAQWAGPGQLPAVPHLQQTEQQEEGHHPGQRRGQDRGWEQGLKTKVIRREVDSVVLNKEHSNL